MECPRCGAGMETYSLGGREAETCVSCNYVGVPVEHQSEREEPESWSDALSRFEEKFTGSAIETAVQSDAADLAAIVGEDGDGSEADGSTEADDASDSVGEEGEDDGREGGSDDAETDETEASAEPDELPDDATPEDTEDVGENADAEDVGEDAGDDAPDDDERGDADDEPEVAADGAPEPAASTESDAVDSGPDRSEKRRKRR